MGHSTHETPDSLLVNGAAATKSVETLRANGAAVTQELVGDYQEWSAKVGKAPASIAVLYSDNYGFCDRLSQQLARGIVKADIATEMVDLVRD